MTWFPALEVVPLDKAALFTVTWLFKLSTSDAEDDGDSPKEMIREKKSASTNIIIKHLLKNKD